jgi:hypothetical protein
MAVLLQVGRERLHEDQQALPSGSRWGQGRPRSRGLARSLIGCGHRHQVEALGQVLVGAYTRLGFDVLNDEAVAAMVLAEIYGAVRVEGDGFADHRHL